MVSECETSDNSEEEQVNQTNEDAVIRDSNEVENMIETEISRLKSLKKRIDKTSVCAAIQKKHGLNVAKTQLHLHLHLQLETVMRRGHVSLRVTKEDTQFNCTQTEIKVC